MKQKVSNHTHHCHGLNTKLTHNEHRAKCSVNNSKWIKSPKVSKMSYVAIIQVCKYISCSYMFRGCIVECLFTLIQIHKVPNKLLNSNGVGGIVWPVGATTEAEGSVQSALTWLIDPHAMYHLTNLRIGTLSPPCLWPRGKVGPYFLPKRVRLNPELHDPQNIFVFSINQLKRKKMKG